MLDCLLKNGIIVTVNRDREIFFKGAVAVNNGRIVDVGPSKELEAKYMESSSTINLDGKIIFPGFINTHNHLYQTLLKGLGDDMVLKDWLGKMAFPAASNLTEEATYLGAMLGCMEGLHSGVTTMLDYMHPHPIANLSDNVIRAMRELGIRGIFARGCMDIGEQYGVHPGIMQDTKTIEQDVYRLFDTYHNCDDGRIRIWVAPAAMWSNSRECLDMLWRVTKEYHSGLTVHISETQWDRDAAKELYGKPDAELLEKMGIVGPNVLMVHCCHLSDKDISMAKEYDLKVSHCVCSNQYLSSGVADVPKMLHNGITVSLGVDGAASNNSQDMIELMKFTALQHKVATCDPLAMTAEKVLEMATIDGAKALGLEDEIGSLEVGKKADLVIFDPLECLKAIPMHNPVSTLVYASSLKNIVAAMVDGKMVMEKGIITTVKDEKEIYRQVQKYAESLCERGHITNRLEGHKWNSIGLN